jgi:hypothetical protein
MLPSKNAIVYYMIKHLDSEYIDMFDLYIKEHVDALQRKKTYFIDLDQLYTTIGYTRKDNVVNLLKRLDDEHYDKIEMKLEIGRPTCKYLLSMEGASVLCCIAKTPCAQRFHKFLFTVLFTYMSFLEEDARKPRIVLDRTYTLNYDHLPEECKPSVRLIVDKELDVRQKLKKFVLNKFLCCKSDPTYKTCLPEFDEQWRQYSHTKKVDFNTHSLKEYLIFLPDECEVSFKKEDDGWYYVYGVKPIKPSKKKWEEYDY